MTGAAIEIPLIAATVWLLARLGAGNPEAPLMHILRLTAVFAGVAALLTAGGIGRLAAYAFAEEPRGQPSEAAPGADLAARRRRAIGRAARAHAVAGAGLVIIAAIPQGHLPETTAGWLALPAAGLAYGALAGAIIGVVCTSQTSLVQLADVWSLARRPQVALRTLLDPEDLARLGSALRARTTNLFEGIFEPAPPPPGAPPAPTAEPAREERPASREAAGDSPASPRAHRAGPGGAAAEDRRGGGDA